MPTSHILKFVVDNNSFSYCGKIYLKQFFCFIECMFIFMSMNHGVLLKRLVHLSRRLVFDLVSINLKNSSQQISTVAVMYYLTICSNV